MPNFRNRRCKADVRASSADGRFISDS
jgi:hypothetical protein